MSFYPPSSLLYAVFAFLDGKQLDGDANGLQSCSYDGGLIGLYWFELCISEGGWYVLLVGSA